MKKIAHIAFASAVLMALAGCGSSDDASTDAMADDVEVPADEAMAASEDAGETPVADDAATEDAIADAEKAADANNAADAAAATVADVEAAASEAPAN